MVPRTFIIKSVTSALVLFKGIVKCDSSYLRKILKSKKKNHLQRGFESHSHFRFCLFQSTYSNREEEGEADWPIAFFFKYNEKVTGASRLCLANRENKWNIFLT